jgi:hypothetical protein
VQQKAWLKGYFLIEILPKKHYQKKTTASSNFKLIFFSRTELFLNNSHIRIAVSQDVNPQFKLRLRNFFLDDPLLISGEKPRWLQSKKFHVEYTVRYHYLG